MNKTRLIALILIFCIGGFYAGGSRAQITVDEALQQAESAYAAGDYSRAAALYRDLVANGFISFEIYYNLGSAYYEQGLLGDALLSYRYAQALNPRHTGLNLMLIRIRAERVDFQGDEVTLIDALATLSESSFTLQEVAWAVLVLWSAWFALLMLWVLRPVWRRWLLYALGVGLLLLVIGLGLLLPRLYAMQQRPVAVVLELTAPVMSGPGEDYLQIKQLFAAAEMRVVAEQGEWVQFILPDGRRGWIIRDAIGIV